MEGIREVLLTLSLAFDNFVEANDDDSGYAKNRFGSFDDGFSQQHYRISFNRPSRKTTPSSSSRKRSWESEMEATSTNGFFSSIEDFNHHGKRSKSFALAHELEYLRLGTVSTSPPSSTYSVSSTNEIEQALNSLAEQDLSNSNEFNEHNGFFNYPVQQDMRAFTHWIKWSFINELYDSIKCADKTVSSSSIKSFLTRFTFLFKGLINSASSIDWPDPELAFVILRLLQALLNCERFLQTQSSSNNHSFTTTTTTSAAPSKVILTLNRRLEEYFGLLRILNLFLRLPIKTEIFELLLSRPETCIHILEFHESFLEIVLNVFELVTTINSSSPRQHFHQLMSPSCIAAAFTLLMTKSIARLGGDDVFPVKDLIFKIYNFRIN